MELEDHVPVYIPEPKHPEDLVPAEDEAPIEPYIIERATAPSIYQSLLLAETPPLLPIPLPVPSTSHRAEIPEDDTPPQKRLLLTAPTPRVEVGESSAAAAARQPGSTMALWLPGRESLGFYSRHQEAQEDRAAMRVEIEILRRERLAYEVLETQAYRHEWQHQDAYDYTIEHIMRTQALEAGACVDTLEDTGSSA
ncbi:hypothetical protein Tco_0922618 [Tanacetum coccineum]|uniref:Uncharacterized protein n=1 Tax=Tanacetum coccineum TaxID=301880 RepID=A0ABQ5D5V8_9ASTR